MKVNKCLSIYSVIILILIGVFYYLLTVRTEIYFNMWFNHLVAKSDLGKLLETKDPEDFVMNKIYTDGKVKVNMEGTFTRVRYDKIEKSVNIFLLIPKIENKSLQFLSFKEIPKSISQKICEDVNTKAIYGSLSNQFTINGEEIWPNRFKSFVKNMKCYFLSDDTETAALTTTGGWMFSLNRDEEPSEIK